MDFNEIHNRSGYLVESTREVDLIPLEKCGFLCEIYKKSVSFNEIYKSIVDFINKRSVDFNVIFKGSVDF